METEKTIKEIYGCGYVESTEKLYPLQKWYNQLLDKTISEISISDITRMIRQKEFTDIAVKKALDFLSVDIFAGDMYEGELLEKLSEMNSRDLVSYTKDLKNIISDASEKSKRHDWLNKDEKEDFEEIVHNISKKVTGLI